MPKVLLINYPASSKDFRLMIMKHFLEKMYGVDVCVNPLWGDYKKKTEIAKNPLNLLRSSLREFKYLIRLLSQIKINDYKFIIIGYPAYIEALILNLFLSKRNKNKIIIDFFLSLYDTLVLDRKAYHEKSIKAKICYYLDKHLLSSFDHLVVDTSANAKRFSSLFKVDSTNFQVLFAGSNSLRLNGKSFRKHTKEKNQNTLNIGWVGAIIPLHGIEEIINSAEILRREDIIFHLIGNGPDNELDHIKRIIESKKLNNVVLYDELDYEKSMNILNNCDICLGIFGKSEKAKAVIPFKIFDYLYLSKPIITQKSDAILQIKDFEQLFTVDNDAMSMAEQIQSIELNKPCCNKSLLEKTISDQYKCIFKN
jgi:glycosyltransferase involved in cell wall biosynthesis